VTGREIARPGGSGRDGLAGYEYQIDVSIWFALQLMVVSKLTHQLVLEPPSDEDAEAEITETVPGKVTSRFEVENYTLVVQAKLRGGDAWTVPNIKALLEYGSQHRISAAKRLADPKIRYVLVTSAGLNGRSKGLRTRRPGEWPKPGEMPATVLKAVGKRAAGRVAVIGNEDEETLKRDIKELLVEYLKVPNDTYEACRDALRKEARIRLLEAGGGCWQRQDVEQIIRDHDGRLASSIEMEQFVKPTNWSELLATMKDKHAALIIGQSGTGKTLATTVLYDELRQQIPGLKRVKITRGPAQLRGDETKLPVLYDIEDPWGKFDFEAENRVWSSQLDSLFRHASHDRMYIATTRRDVAHSAKVLKNMRAWQVPLESDHYGDRERATLYQNRVDLLPWELRLPVGTASQIVLGELATPLEIHKFFDAVLTLDRKKFSDQEAWIKKAIADAHENSIERIVVEQIEHRNDVSAAAVVWALLKVADRFSFADLLHLDRALSKRLTQLPRGVTPLAQFFVAARNLRQREEFVSYYHPRVEAGIEKLLKGEHILTSNTLEALIDVWLSFPDADQRGAGMAANLLGAIPRKSPIRIEPTPQNYIKIDAWLVARLDDGELKFEEELRLAAAAGSDVSRPAAVARYLLHREERSGWYSFDHWRAPKRDDEWYSTHGADPRTRSIVEKFIRDVLPFSHGRYEAGFARDVKRLVPDLNNAFLDAAHTIVRFGVVNSDGAIVEGALDDLAGFASVLKEAFEAMTPSPKEAARREELHLALLNGEYSDDHAEHLQDDDDGYTAGQFVKAYVRRVRTTGDWQHLDTSPYRDQLRVYWLEAILEELKEPWRDEDDAAPNSARTNAEPGEIQGAFAAAFDTTEEGLVWFVINSAWSQSYLSPLLARVKQEHLARNVRLGILTCLIEQAPDELPALWEDLSSNDSAFRLVEISLDLAYLRYERASDWKDHGPAALAATAFLPRPYKELGDAFLEILLGRRATVSESAQALAESLQKKTEDTRRIRLAVGGPQGSGWQQDVRWILDHTEKPQAGAEAVAAAKRAGLREDIERSLTHKFAKVRAEALRAVADAGVAPHSSALLGMASDKGRAVRAALVCALTAKIDPSHMPALLQLAADRYSTGNHYVGDNAVLPIAREAIDAIKLYGTLSLKDANQLKSIGISSDDPTLRGKIFDLLATNGGDFGLVQLFDLATTPGRGLVRRQAAAGLCSSLKSIPQELLSKITPELLASQIASVAAPLAIVLGIAGDDSEVKVVAQSLAANHHRRVLLVLLIRTRHDIGSKQAKELAALLPEQHPALDWAFGSEIDWENDKPLSDIGDPPTCRAVFRIMES
jgi:hypothetical protein